MSNVLTVRISRQHANFKSVEGLVKSFEQAGQLYAGGGAKSFMTYEETRKIADDKPLNESDFQQFLNLGATVTVRPSSL